MQQVNVKSVFFSKNPSLARLLPGFVFRLLEKIIHQDEMNHFLSRYGHLEGIDFVTAVLNEFNVEVVVKGKENLPLQGRCVFAGNHPLGGFDGMVLIKILGEHYGDMRFLVNDILMNIENLRKVFLPINKHGGHSREAALLIGQAFASDMPIATFPAGLCSRRIKGQITDLPWKNNFLKKAIASRRDIVPVFFNARNSNLFYSLANLRKKLGIKANIEMFLLPDEMFKFRNRKITVVFGKPLPYTLFDSSRSIDQWVEFVREKVYALNETPS